mgnify:CR=1 FL=1
MNYLNIVNENCNYKFFIEFTNQNHFGEEFTCEGNVIKFAGLPIEEALFHYPELPHLTFDDSPYNSPDSFCLKIEPFELFTLVYFMYDLTTEIPIRILNRKGMDNVEEWIKNVYHLYSPFQFKKIVEAGLLKDYKTNLTTKKVIEWSGDTTITHIMKELKSEDCIVFRRDNTGRFTGERIKPLAREALVTSVAH